MPVESRQALKLLGSVEAFKAISESIPFNVAVQIIQLREFRVNYPLSSHWVNGWGYRDELNSSDIDYKNTSGLTTLERY
jgi:hypothetical protein